MNQIEKVQKIFGQVRLDARGVDIDPTLSVEGVAADAAAVGEAVGKLDTRLMSIPDIGMHGGTATTYTAASTEGQADGVYYTKVADDTPSLWELIGGTIEPRAIMGGSPPGYKWTITADGYVRLSDNAFGFAAEYATFYAGVVVATAATTIHPVLNEPEVTAQIPGAGIYLGTYWRDDSVWNYISSLTYNKGQTIDPRFLDASGEDLFIISLIPNNGKITTETTWQELQDALSAGKPVCLNAGSRLLTDVGTTDSSVSFYSLSYDGAGSFFRIEFSLRPDKNGEIDVTIYTTEITIPNSDYTLGLTSATVGQIAKITAVDTDGKPTAWEAVDMDSEKFPKFTKLLTHTITQDELDSSPTAFVWGTAQIPNLNDFNVFVLSISRPDGKNITFTKWVRLKINNSLMGTICGTSQGASPNYVITANRLFGVWISGNYYNPKTISVPVLVPPQSSSTFQSDLPVSEPVISIGFSSYVADYGLTAGVVVEIWGAK